jgi:CubicO group peptidase (beta-lactamase class C family)
MNTSSSLRLLGIISIVLTTTLARADTLSTTVPEKMKEMIDKNEISGAVTAVVSKDKVLYLGAIGEADMAAHTAMKPGSLFWIASMTKPLTGVSILMLQDEGKLNVDDQVAKFIPEFANLKTPSGKSANLTLKHLLTHTSGLSEATAEQQRSAKVLADLIPYFLAKPTTYEPGAKWSYNQAGINTLGRVVEIVSGQSLPEFFEKRITGPLGMKDTTFYPTKDQQARLAKSYKKGKDGKLEEAPIALFTDLELANTNRVPLANGGLFSTAPDYARFCQMLLNNGTLDGHVYLKPESVKLLSTIHTGELKTGFTPGNGWGLAVCVVREPQGVTGMFSSGTFGHGGAYGTQAWVDPAKGVAYILMVQRRDFSNADASNPRQVFQQAAVDAMR